MARDVDIQKSTTSPFANLNCVKSTEGLRRAVASHFGTGRLLLPHGLEANIGELFLDAVEEDTSGIVDRIVEH